MTKVWEYKEYWRAGRKANFKYLFESKQALLFHLRSRDLGRLQKREINDAVQWLYFDLFKVKIEEREVINALESQTMQSHLCGGGSKREESIQTR